MGNSPRPTNTDEQAAYLVDTGNEPTAPEEATLLSEEFGDPDSNGVYGPIGGDVA